MMASPVAAAAFPLRLEHSAYSSANLEGHFYFALTTCKR